MGAHCLLMVTLIKGAPFLFLFPLGRNCASKGYGKGLCDDCYVNLCGVFLSTAWNSCLKLWAWVMLFCFCLFIYFFGFLYCLWLLLFFSSTCHCGDKVE